MSPGTSTAPASLTMVLTPVASTFNVGVVLVLAPAALTTIVTPSARTTSLVKLAVKAFTVPAAVTESSVALCSSSISASAAAKLALTADVVADPVTGLVASIALAIS